MHFWNSSFETVFRTNLQVIENNSLVPNFFFSTKNYIILIYHLPNLCPNDFGKLQTVYFAFK